MLQMKTIQEVKAEMTRRGETAADWARKHGVSAELVRGVLRGSLKGRIGEAHKIAVLLGVKDGVIVEDNGREYGFKEGVIVEDEGRERA
ncbi:MAG TPA: hypothetical protein DCL01_12590 [Thauera sp.]|nr:hypothetical protein [Thauera sp.]HHW62457.1 DNA-binding protein [Rhodocyclaceae bacterium]